MTKYNGHKNRDYWNVALWIGNDEGLYLLARECKRSTKNATEAARMFLENVSTEKTPDGSKWTQNNVRAAIAGLDS